MIGRFSNADFTIMAGLTIVADYPHMIKRRSRKISRVMTIDAILAIRIGRYVANELAHTDHIVVARVATIYDAVMIVATRGKTTRRMANTAVLTGGHVINRFAARFNTIMAGRAIINEIAMINESASKTLRVMTRTTIAGGSIMSSRGGFTDSINTIVSVVT